MFGWRTLAAEIALAKTMRKYDVCRVISFHNTIKAGREFSQELPNVIKWMPARTRPEGEIWAEHVSGEMSTGHRDRMLLRLSNLETNERGLLCSARCLGEGVDVPTLDGVAFIDPRRSVIDIIQCVGRAIRKAPDKKVGTIVLPVFLTEDDDPETVLNDSTFQDVWRVLKALAAQDETLREELDELRVRSRARRKLPPRRPPKIRLEVPVARVGVQFIEAFNVRLVEQTTAAWEFYFGLLESFVERESHASVPAQLRVDGYRLGSWVTTQRTLFRRGTLEPERRARLQAVPGWTWTPQDDAWDEGFAKLESFVKRNGHGRVPQQWREDDYRLGEWVINQRAQFQRGTLDPERRAQLEAVPGWTWDTREALWEEGFAKLESFVKRDGHARVPAQWREDDYQLGAWVNTQRTRFVQRTLEPERRAQLEAVPGWTWDVREALWEEGFAKLESFVEREGQARVPRKYRDAGGYRLGDWVITQRHVFQQGTLEPSDVLDSTPFRVDMGQARAGRCGESW